uniref:Uncharacterized protein n=1 Tax=Anguilla anguilla TaxID=7936 RepID=A0A0E9T4Y6_ANGAN
MQPFPSNAAHFAAVQGRATRWQAFVGQRSNKLVASVPEAQETRGRH